MPLEFDSRDVRILRFPDIDLQSADLLSHGHDHDEARDQSRKQDDEDFAPRIPECLSESHWASANRPGAIPQCS